MGYATTKSLENSKRDERGHWLGSNELYSLPISSFADSIYTRGSVSMNYRVSNIRTKTILLANSDIRYGFYQPLVLVSNCESRLGMVAMEGLRIWVSGTRDDAACSLKTMIITLQCKLKLTVGVIKCNESHLKERGKNVCSCMVHTNWAWVGISPQIAYFCNGIQISLSQLFIKPDKGYSSINNALIWLSPVSGNASSGIRLIMEANLQL